MNTVRHCSELYMSPNNITYCLQNHSLYDQPTHELEGAYNNNDQPHIPLLLCKSYARSKSLMYDELHHFRVYLKWCALDHSTYLRKYISYIVFFVLAILVPTITSTSIKIPSSAPSEDPLSFNKLVQVPESGLALIAFLTLCGFFKEYGLRHLMFLDDLNHDSMDVQRGYKGELDKAFRHLAYILLPSFLVEFAHKIIFFSTAVVSLPVIGVSVVPMNSIMFLSGLAAWVYRTGVFLLVCVLFRLTCELQILRLEGIRHMLEGCGSEAIAIFRQHQKIRDQLYVTSHRFRFFTVACLVTITVSQLGALMLVLASKSRKNFFNSGDLMVCSAVQLSGFFLCLMGAARITHRAQGIVPVATRWHMFVTSSYNEESESECAKDETLTANRSAAPNADVGRDGSEVSSDIVVKVAEEPSAFQTRQALVTYLQHNNGGITVFGFTLDRGLLHTLFAFEFSIVLWILGKVIVLS